MLPEKVKSSISYINSSYDCDTILYDRLLKDALSRNLVDTCSAGLTVDLTISVRQNGGNSFLLPPKQILL